MSVGIISMLLSPQQLEVALAGVATTLVNGGLISAISTGISIFGSQILSGLLTGGGSAQTGPVRDEGVSTRVSPDTGNRLPLVYGDQRMKGTTFMSELSSDNDTWITMVAVAEGEIDSFTKVSWGDKESHTRRRRKHRTT